jgi:hypothetical protein
MIFKMLPCSERYDSFYAYKCKRFHNTRQTVAFFKHPVLLYRVIHEVFPRLIVHIPRSISCKIPL